MGAEEWKKLNEAKTRAEFEAIAGSPVRATTTSDGNRVAVYEVFDADKQMGAQGPDRPRDIK